MRENRMNLKLMSARCLPLLLALGAASAAQAQNTIYRCGNEYTNNANQARERGCKPVDGGNVTVVEGTRPAVAASGAAKPSSPAGAPKVTANDQRARDSDARAILEAELRKAQARRILVANQLVGPANMAIIAELLEAGGTEVFCLVDSAANADALDAMAAAIIVERWLAAPQDAVAVA
mgnify:CR=1 FL=1